MSAPFPGYSPQVGNVLTYKFDGMTRGVQARVLEIYEDGSCLVLGEDGAATIREADVRRAWDHGQAMIERHNL